MAVKANQQYYADGEYIDKQAREFQPTSEFKNKIDSIEEGAQVNVIEDIKVNGESVAVEDKTVELTIPIVIDNLYTTDGLNALSAKQGKILYDLVQNLQARGRYLSNWNTATGLPVTIPESSPYQYKPGDYFVVSAVAEEGGTNYRPNGSEFIVGQASTTVETNTVNVTDLYLYDGTNWNLLINSAREIPIDPSLSTTSTNPVENRVVTNAINNKQDKLIAGTNIQINNDGKTISATDTTYTAGANINIDANNEISAVDTTYTAGANVQISNSNVISATDTTYTAGTGIDITNGVITNTQTSAEWGNITGTLSDQTDLQSALDNKQDKFHTISATAPSNPSEGDEWYDSTNDILMVYDGTDWKEAGTQMKILSYGYSTWQDFIDAYKGNAIVYCRASSNSNPASGTQGRMAFMAFVNNADNPTEVEFQYYRSRNNHDSAANQVDEVYVYKLVPANDGTWTVTQRNTAAKLVAGSNVSITWGSGNAVINATGTAYTAGDGINITSGEISVDASDIAGTGLTVSNNNLDVDSTVVALKSDLSNYYTKTQTYSKAEVDNLIASVGSFEVVATLPSADTADTKKIYLLGPIGTGADKYEEYIVTETTTQGHFESVSEISHGVMNRSYDGASGQDFPIQIDGQYLSNVYLAFNNLEGENFRAVGVGDGNTSELAFDLTEVTLPYAHNTLIESPVGYATFDEEGGYSVTFDLYASSSPLTWVGASTQKVWTKIGETSVDLSGYATTTALTNGLATKQDTLTAGNGISIDANNEISVDTDVIQEKLTAGDGITIENVCTDISDMQGPAPDGFHVPLNTEWQAMYDIWTALGGGSSDGTNFGIALKLPLAGDRFRGSSSVSDQGAYGRYRSSTRTNASNAYSIHFDSSVISPQTASQRSNGLSVRCFKNSPIVPTPSWTKLYGMSIESGGIFWSSTDGLISLSSNGQTWVTIMDKNLGATTVWNSGDTLSEANCGKYYQRGNNYGFPRTGTVTTSSTQVDASAYGPGNYYSSSTFITRSSSPYRWDTTDNANLRGGVSQGSSQECALTISADTTVLATKTDLNSKQDTLVSGTNIKTINNESLLGSGDITISAPTYTAGDGIDITNNEISVDTDVIQEKLTAGTGISITGGTVCITESDRKGPAPSGFHVPSGLEWGDILNGLQLLGLSGCENAMTYLKLPMAGYREYDTTYLDNRGTVGCYWSSTPNDSTTAYILSFDGTDISSGNSITRSAGLPIRAFKNTIALPDNTWTVLSGTLGSGGVFWNQTEGLITVTGDGTTGYTIMDKNLGATQVWNYGDAEGQEETCGQTYQWGNNYGFTGDDNLVILDPSHTKRDVTGYGPTNYYSNSYWVAESPWQDSTSNGNDLWGNVSNSTHQECETTPLTISSTVNGFNPASTGTTGQILTKTSSGYDWDNAPDSSNVKTFPLSGTGSSAAVLAEAQEIYDWYNAGKTALIYYSGSLFTFASGNTSSINFTNIKCENMTGTSTSGIVYDVIKLDKTDDTITNVTFTDKGWIISANYLNTATRYQTPYTPLYDGSPATKKYVDDNAGMKLAPNSPLSPKYHWFGTEAQYQALSQYYTDEENDTVYYTI